MVRSPLLVSWMGTARYWILDSLIALGSLRNDGFLRSTGSLLVCEFVCYIGSLIHGSSQGYWLADVHWVSRVVRRALVGRVSSVTRLAVLLWFS